MTSTASAVTSTSTATSTVEQVFNECVQFIQEDREIREVIRQHLNNLDQSSRELAAVLQKIHPLGGIKNIPTIIADAKTLLSTKVRPQLRELSSLIPANQFYRFHGMFSFSLQRVCFGAAFIKYLQDETLLTRDQMKDKDWLDVGEELEKTGFQIDLEDYLAGVILMSNELSRFCVNSVTEGDYQRPLRISSFMNDLLNGFRLLNLKNDGLRKKFDSLKYDLKKVEEVVYDISIRGLVGKEKQEIEEKK